MWRAIALEDEEVALVFKGSSESDCTVFQDETVREVQVGQGLIVFDTLGKSLRSLDSDDVSIK